jgi:hypothetical protein
MKIEEIPAILLPHVTEQDGRLYFQRDFWSCGPQFEHDCLTGYIEELKQ